MKNAIVAAATLALVALPSIGFAQADCDRGGFRGSWYVGLSAVGTDVSCQMDFYGQRGRFTGACYTIDITEYPPVPDVENVEGIFYLNPACGFEGIVSVVGGGIYAQTEGYASTPTSGRPVTAQGMAYLSGLGVSVYAPMVMHRRTNAPTIPWLPEPE